MQYFSTRNQNITKKPSEAILQGIADDGGLYMPESFEGAKFPMEALTKMTPKEISEAVLSLLFGRDDMFREEGSLEKAVSLAYDGKFDGEDYAPLSKVGNAHVMELYHGPTCAFKDVALQLLPRLLAEAKKVNEVKEKIVILTATSGDTGSAALSGFSDVDGVSIIVFYPKNGISAVQERQMTSCKGKNTCVCAIEGNFDDAQSGVKAIFNTMEVPENIRLSSANSINIGRLAPQVAYYFKAYGDLLKTGEIAFGDKVNFVVPTGNFGDILAGYFAMQMGLPVGKLVCASNKNNILTDFLRTGVYDRNRAFHTTMSPSMDILISSNLERLLYLIAGSEETASYMKQLNEKGVYKVSDEVMAKIQKDFCGYYCDEDGTAKTIKSIYEGYNYLADTHTAVAISSALQYLSDEKDGAAKRIIIASTASPYKFASAVYEALADKTAPEGPAALDALSELTGVEITAPLAGLDKKTVRFTRVIDSADMPAVAVENTK